MLKEVGPSEVLKLVSCTKKHLREGLGFSSGLRYASGVSFGPQDNTHPHARAPARANVRPAVSSQGTRRQASSFSSVAPPNISL